MTWVVWSLGCNANWAVVSPIVTFALVVALVGTVQLREHRFLQMAIVTDLRCIQGTLTALVGAHGFKVRPIKFKTSEIMDERMQ